jgi:hypothetical protein
MAKYPPGNMPKLLDRKYPGLALVPAPHGSEPCGNPTAITTSPEHRCAPRGLSHHTHLALAR